jgi:hypothetical protein
LPEGCLEFVRIDQTKQAPKRIVRRNSVLKLQIPTQPIQFLVRPEFDLNEGVRPHQHGIHRHNEQIDQVVLNLPGLPRVSDRDEYIG